MQFAIPTHHASISACSAVAFVGAQTCKGTKLVLVAAASIRVQAMPVRSSQSRIHPNLHNFLVGVACRRAYPQSNAIPNQTPSPAKPASSKFNCPPVFFAFRPKLVQSQSLLTPAADCCLGLLGLYLACRLSLSEFSSEERKPLSGPLR